MKGAIGAAALASREAYQAGMPPFSFAPLQQFCSLQGRGVKSGLICSGARQSAAGRVIHLARPANTEPERNWPVFFFATARLCLGLFGDAKVYC